MELCIVRHKVKTNHVGKHLGNYDTEDSRTKTKCLCFEVCALCLSSTKESSRLYMWQYLMGGWKMVRGAKWRETMKECTSARSIFKERGREHALLHAVAEP